MSQQAELFGVSYAYVHHGVVFNKEGLWVKGKYVFFFLIKGFKGLGITDLCDNIY